MTSSDMMKLLEGSFQKSSKIAEKIEKANKEKEEGNHFFKQGQNQEALKHYHQGLLNINGLVGLDQKETSQVNEIKVTICNNMAAVYLKQRKHEKAITYCNKVLEIDKRNVKAIFRRGKAYLEKDDVERAQEDLKEAEKINPEDSSIKKELALLKKKSAEQDKKQQKFYSNMFSKLNEANEKEAASKKSEKEELK